MIGAVAEKLDLNAEVQLDPTIDFHKPLSEHWAAPRSIFLTGATGFLGAYLLATLLQKTEANLYCLVRCTDSGTGQQRLKSHLEFYALWEEAFHSRIIPVPGDLAQPHLGLYQQAFAELATQLDVIYHNGALVNSAVSYEVLKPINVLGTQEVLRLASVGHTKPVHFVSTLAVFLGSAYAQITEENWPDLTSLKGGYKQSKSVAERLILIAQERGLPACIYRPARIMGHRETGINGNLSDFLCSLIKGCLELGQAPDSDSLINLMPVDYVSDAIVHLSQQKNPFHKTFHLLNPQPIAWNELCNLIRSLGYPLETVPFDRWLTQLQNKATQDPNNELYASLLILLSSPAHIFSPKAPVETKNTLEGLANSEIACPEINLELVKTYFAYFEKIGYLPKPNPTPTASPATPKKAASGFWKSIRSKVKSTQQAFVLEPVPRDREFPLSFGQERLWLIDHLQPNNPVHNLRAVFRLQGPLDPKILLQSLQEIIRRHEILRTTFPAVNGQPIQVISPEVQVDLPIVDLSTLSPAEQEAEVRRIAGEEARKPFDLAHGPLIRFKLLHLSVTDHAFVRTVHHIVNDVWTDTVRLRELATLYSAFSKGEPSPLPALTIQYADFAYAQRQWLQGQVLQSQINFWKTQLSGSLSPLQLPVDRPPSLPPNYQGAAQVVVISAPLTGATKALSHQAGVSLFVALLAAYKVLLNRYSGQTDLVLVSPIASRQQPETKKLIGYFSNIVLVRTKLAETQDFRSLLNQVSQVTLGAFEHADIPLPQLAETLHLPSAILSRAMFTLQNVPSQPRELSPDVSLSLQEMEEGTSNFDLSLSMKEKGETLIGVFRYKTDLFEAATIAQLCQNFQIILEELVANPDRPLTELPSFRGNQQVPLTNLPQHQPRSTAMDYVAPVEKLDRQIAEIWQKVLQVESVGLHDNFFAIGGRSLAMIQVYSQLQNLGNLDLSLGELFKHPTVFEMAQYLRQKDVENCLTYEANPKNYR